LSEPLVIGTPVAAFEPRPPGAPGYRPDTAVDGWSTPALTVRAASVRGYQHRYDGTPRQDDVTVGWHPGSGAVVAAVADGVSDAALAHLGATLACRCAVEQVLRAVAEQDGPDWADVLRCAGWALVDFAAAQPARPDEDQPARAERLFATTLVTALVRPDGTAEVTRVGDSAAWLLDGGAFSAVFDTPGDDDLTEAATPALPRVPSDPEVRTLRLPAGSVLLLGTDGVGGPLGDGTGLVGSAFAELLATPPAPLEFARLLDFSRETFDDDRTLVGVWPREPG
jgi:hypothetical protein